MSIQDEIAKVLQMAHKVHDDSAALILALSGLDVHTAPTPPIVTQPKPPLVIPPAAPDGGSFPGEGDAAVRQVIRESAQVAGIHPAVLEAIEVWETGHYRDPAAKAWLEGNNPGGMKSSSVTQALGQVGTEGPYAEFPSWQAGIRAHGGFLRQPRYDAARAAGLSVVGQVRAIWDAGYSEKAPDWLTNVTAIALKLEAVYAGSQAPMTPPTELQTRRAAVVAKARSGVNKGVEYELGAGGGDPSAPLPRKSDCSGYGGRCLGYSRDDLGLNTDGAVADAKGPQKYFQEVAGGQIVPSDALVYPSGNGHPYGHWGIVTETVNGIPTKVVHCSSSNAPDSIQETDPSIFTSRGAIALRWHGLMA